MASRRCRYIAPLWNELRRLGADVIPQIGNEGGNGREARRGVLGIAPQRAGPLDLVPAVPALAWTLHLIVVLVTAAVTVVLTPDRDAKRPRDHGSTG